MIKTSERLQQLFKGCQQPFLPKAVEAQAVCARHLDECNGYNPVGEFKHGIEAGLTIHSALLTARETEPDASIWLVTTDDWVDGDGFMLFIGTEDELATLFTANTN